MTAATGPGSDTRAGSALAARTGDRVFPGRPDQVRHARAFARMLLDSFPGADDAVLCISELASNSVLHSRSGRPGGTFTVRIKVLEERYVRIEVEDDGGPWQEPMTRDDDRMHGLQIISELADTCGREGSSVTGWVTWARLNWPSTNGHLLPHAMGSDTQLVRLDVGGWISGPCLDAAALAPPDGLAEPNWAWPAEETQRPAE